MPEPPERWLICGGGRHNETMMHMISDAIGLKAEPVEAVELDGDMLEAQFRALKSSRFCSEPMLNGRHSSRFRGVEPCKRPYIVLISG